MKCQKCQTTKPPLYTHITSYAPLEYTILCKQCHNEEHGKGLSLIEIFEECEPVVNGHIGGGAYRATFIIQPKPNRPTITQETLQQYVQNLKQRYPDQKFYLTTVKYQGKTLHKISKITNPQDKPRIPIYFDLQNQKFYVEKKSLIKNEKLTNYIIMVTLGALGISQSIYANGITRRIPYKRQREA